MCASSTSSRRAMSTTRPWSSACAPRRRAAPATPAPAPCPDAPFFGRFPPYSALKGQRTGGGAAAGAGDHVGQRERVEVPAHGVAHIGPDRQQHALPLVVARTVLVGLAEVARHDGPVDGAHDLPERDLLRLPS